MTSSSDEKKEFFHSEKLDDQELINIVNNYIPEGDSENKNLTEGEFVEFLSRAISEGNTKKFFRIFREYPQYHSSNPGDEFMTKFARSNNMAKIIKELFSHNTDLLGNAFFNSFEGEIGISWYHYYKTLNKIRNGERITCGDLLIIVEARDTELTLDILNDESYRNLCKFSQHAGYFEALVVALDNDDVEIYDELISNWEDIRGSSIEEVLKVENRIFMGPKNYDKFLKVLHEYYNTTLLEYPRKHVPLDRESELPFDILETIYDYEPSVAWLLQLEENKGVPPEISLHEYFDLFYEFFLKEDMEGLIQLIYLYPAFKSTKSLVGILDGTERNPRLVKFINSLFTENSRALLGDDPIKGAQNTFYQFRRELLKGNRDLKCDDLQFAILLPDKTYANEILLNCSKYFSTGSIYWYLDVIVDSFRMDDSMLPILIKYWVKHVRKSPQDFTDTLDMMKYMLSPEQIGRFVLYADEK